MTEQAWYHMTKGDERARVKCNCKLCREKHYEQRVQEFLAPTPEVIPQSTLHTDWTGSAEWISGVRGGYRVVDSQRDIVTSDTGGSKGTKTARFDLIDQRFLWSLAEVCGFGAGIYGDNNWRRGYDWSLSYAALMRHLSLFLQGEDMDPESGQPHIAHVAWHAMVLFVFSDPENVDEYGRFDTRDELG